MTMILSGHSRQLWGGPSWSTNATYYDSSKVGFAINLLESVLVPMSGFHPAPSGSLVVYTCRMYASLGMGLGEDGFLVNIKDIDGNVIVHIDLANGQWRPVIYGDTTVYGSFGTTFSAGNHDLMIKVDVTASAITCDIYFAGVLYSTATAVNTVGGRGVARNFEWAINNAIWGTTMFSEFAIFDAVPTSPRFVQLEPNADGTDTDLDGVVGNLTDGDEATGVTATATLQKSSWGLETYSGTDSIAEFVASGWVMTGVGTSANGRFYLVIGGVRYYGSSKPLTSSEDEPISESWALDPSDSLAWTAAKVNAVEVGFEVIA